MRERALLFALVMSLFGGLAAWALSVERSPSPARTARPPPPPIGTPTRLADPLTADDRRALETASLAGMPLVRVFQRAGTPLHAIVVPARDALALRARLAERVQHRVPVVLGDGWAVRAHARATATTTDPPTAVVRRARHIDVEAWLRARAEAVGPVEGSWPEQPPARPRLPTPLRTRGLDPSAAVAIGLVPAERAHEVPAWLAFGNWRGCPEPTVHVAVLARWHARWGAELVVIDADGMDLHVARPPVDRDAALSLAREHVAYAPTLLDGGQGQPRRTLRALAAERIGATVWSFRWPRRALLR